MIEKPDGWRIASAAAGARHTPALSLLLGYAAMAPFALGAIAAWILNPGHARLAIDLTILWGGVILAFLAGVRRGLSFRTAGGPTAAQIATMLWLFALSFAALAVPSAGAALLLLLVGYLSLGILDPWAARRGEVPLFFARLRPIQMLIPVTSLLAMLALSIASP